MAISFSEMAAIRLGSGLSPRHPAPEDADAVLADLIDAAPGQGAMTTARAVSMRADYYKLFQARNEGEAQLAAYKAVLGRMRAIEMADARDRIGRAVDARVGFGERLVAFWADHFTVRGNYGGYQPLAVSLVDDAIRPNLTRPFAQMLVAVTTHPMMLVYLNQDQSVGPNSIFARRRAGQREFGLNENLARELIELHTLGVGASYTQDDVRQLAELLTGLVYRIDEGTGFDPRRAEPGAEQVLGGSYGGASPARLGEVTGFLGDLARHPDTARYIGRKLAVHFAADDPPQALAGDLAAVWTQTGGDLAQVYAVLVTHPDMASSFRAKARQPLDYLVAGLRALGLTRDEIAGMDDRRTRQVLLNPLYQMGQRWGNPPGPNGWPEEGDAWINPQALAARINWAMNMPVKLRDPLPEPPAFLDLALGDTASEPLHWAVPKAESIREGVGIVLASSDFNRR